MDIKINKQNTKVKKCLTEAKWDRKSINTPLSSFFVWSTTGHGAWPNIWLIYPVKLHLRKQVFPLPMDISFWLWVGGHVPFSLLVLVTSGSYLYGWSYVCCHCEFIYPSVLLCLEDHVSLESVINSDSCNLSISSFA